MVRIAFAIRLPGRDVTQAGTAGVRLRGAANGGEMGSDSGRRIGVLISGRGSNLQALIDAIADGRLDAEIAVVVSNRPDAHGLERARAAGSPR